MSRRARSGYFPIDHSIYMRRVRDFQNSGGAEVAVAFSAGSCVVRVASK